MGGIRDDREMNRFELVVDGQTAELDYRIQGDRLWVVHTGVPRAVEGRGIAGRMMEAVVARAKEDGLTIVPQCSYAQYWLDEHRNELGDVAVAG